jgi:hypothetical protein
MARYGIGIDLGTTHSAVSYFKLDRDSGRGAGQPMLPLPQLTAPGTVEARTLLPSFLYLPNDAEFPGGSLSLPWAKDSRELTGEFARSHGAKVPGRLVSSAKSWLGHAGVDRRSAILPWGAPADVPKLSPVDASARYLAHLAAAWGKALGEEAPLSEQDVVLTVPASFDAGARELTLEAARRAGFPEVTLLEEPQAALYAWLEGAGEGFRRQVKPGDVLLVVDVGGGTSDFSLIAVTERNGDLELSRLAVGDHILLGGDNMDLALAHALSQKLAAEGKKLDAFQLSGLAHACRAAKETMYADPSLQEHAIAVAGRGSSLLGGTVRTTLLRSELDAVLGEGFFPACEVTAAPQAARRLGLQQVSLPYAQDAAITRHLASFLSRQGRALATAEGLPLTLPAGRAFLHPTAVLFNGGVFKAAELRTRLVAQLNGWLKADGGAEVRELPGADLDLAVARGAAYYAWVRRGHGLRIRGGTARAYYVGVEGNAPAIPGVPAPVRALCVAPFGMEEGTAADVPPEQFGVLVGEPTPFRFFSSSVRREDRVGSWVEDVEGTDELEELAPLETTLPADGRAGQVVPVQLQAAVTELGQLELRCLEQGGPGKWKLELNVRMKD